MYAPCMWLIDPAALDTDDGRPAYRQIADAIRNLILRSQLKTGDTVPSEANLADELGVARQTVREAYELLRGEGRLIRRRGKPTTVRASVPVRRLATSRYGEELARVLSGATHEPTAAFCTDHGITWTEYGIDAAFTEVPATANHAQLLSVPESTPLLRRVLVEHARGVAVQIRVSCLPLTLVAGTPVADPAMQPWSGGTIAELYSLGKVVERVDEALRVRRPTPWEARTLEIARELDIWENTRVFVADGVPTEVSEVVMPASGNTMHWSSSLDATIAHHRRPHAATATTAQLA